ncbi:unnamed protein product [Arabidopsis lyrata]|uniref:Uncharacterized protein n=1 Tax=Arabidopsis lyrata subsp. lyrata TaxID=81972 RepID=D7KTK6_ARALL|nr:hypothetical protein ARALYDRAFT_894248 [Arabidopsis lyrata subsp. lyrata]CAH8257138.1 unnamed protein product [Arabidopsis lyrata]
MCDGPDFNTLIFFLITSSVAAILEVPSLIGVERKIPTGPDLLHNAPHHNPHQPSPGHRHWIGVEEKNIERSWNYVDYDSPHPYINLYIVLLSLHHYIVI